MIAEIPAFLIEEDNFHNAWVKAIRTVLCYGSDLVIGGKEERKTVRDACILFSLTGKAIKQIEAKELHPQFPFKRVNEYCREFTSDFLREYKLKSFKERFTYLYLERLTEYKTDTGIIDQLRILRTCLAEQIKENITSNRCQAITWYTSDVHVRSPPCAQRIQIRYIPEKMVDVHLTWRSRDLFTAWQLNLICFIELLNREVVKPNDCRIVRIIDYNDSLHIYKRDLEEARKINFAPL